MTHGLRPILERHEVENGPKAASADLTKSEEHEMNTEKGLITLNIFSQITNKVC